MNQGVGVELEVDDALDRCRHGKTAGERCAVCDSGPIDLRAMDIDVSEHQLVVDPADD